VNDMPTLDVAVFSQMIADSHPQTSASEMAEAAAMYMPAFQGQMDVGSMDEPVANSEVIRDVIHHFDEAGLLNGLSEEKMEELEAIAEGGSLEDLAVFLYENTGFSDDPRVTRVMENIFSDSVITLRDLDTLGAAMEYSRASRLELLNDFDNAGLLDNMSDAQREELEAIAQHGSLKDLAIFLYENTGFAEDPRVERVMDRIFSDDVVSLREIEKLGAFMERSRESRLELLNDFDNAGLLDNMNDAQREELEAIAQHGSLKDLAIFLYENTGFAEDPRVERVMDRIFSDDVVSLREIEKLGVVMERSRESRFELLNDFDNAGLLENMSDGQREELEAIAQHGSLKDLAIFLYANTGLAEDPPVERAMDRIFSDDVVSLREIEKLGAVMERSRESRIELLNDFNNAGLLENMNDGQREELEAIAQQGSLKDLAIFLYENTGFAEDPGVTAVMDEIFSDDTVSIQEIEKLGEAMQAAAG